MVGDKPRDIEAGRAAGCRTILVGRGAGPGALAGEREPEHYAPDLEAAAALILGNTPG
jgi:phosphoglycolate phosphatase-like HAD superfamily hydrolase